MGCWLGFLLSSYLFLVHSITEQGLLLSWLQLHVVVLMLILSWLSIDLFPKCQPCVLLSKALALLQLGLVVHLFGSNFPVMEAWDQVPVHLDVLISAREVHVLRCQLGWHSVARYYLGRHVVFQNHGLLMAMIWIWTLIKGGWLHHFLLIWLKLDISHVTLKRGSVHIHLVFIRVTMRSKLSIAMLIAVVLYQGVLVLGDMLDSVL